MKRTTNNPGKKHRLCFLCGSPQHVQARCPEGAGNTTNARIPPSQQLNTSVNSGSSLLANVGFKPPGSTQTHKKFHFQNDFESHFHVPARVRYVHRDLVGAVNDFHYAMMNDTERNDFYYNMLKAAIVPGVSTVLEIGPGSGLLSMIAASLGAKWVLAVEGSKDLADLARNNIAANGFSDRVTVLKMMSTDLRAHHMPNHELATVFVSELFGTLLLGESALDYIAQIRAQPGVLAKDAKILPRHGKQYVVPIHCPSLEVLSSAKPYRGITLDHVNAVRDTSSCVFSKKYGFRLNSIPYTELSDPIEILNVDFASDKPGVLPLTQSQTVVMKKSGVAHAMMLYWKAFDELTGAVLSTDAKDTVNNFARDMQWGQAIQLLDASDAEQNDHDESSHLPKDVVVKEGDEMKLITRASQDSVILQFSLFHKV